MIAYRPERVFVQAESWDDALTAEILQRLKGVPVETVQDADEVIPELRRHSDPHVGGKRCLVLARHRGRFMKDCPGAGAEICCNYFVINYASNCHLECTYCILQEYLNNPALMVFTNAGDLLSEVGAKLAGSPGRHFRIGTGELADSLALDPITAYSRLLVPFFGMLPNGTLELKTKSDCIDNLEGLDHRGHTVVSWSVNAKPITRSEELKTATFEQRVSAARRCQEWGYRVGFHFDPLVHYEGWEVDYRAAVREIFQQVDPGRVAWVSLGALRFTPRLREIVKERFPRSRIPYGEFVPGHHGKFRYFRPIRETMYARMRHWIQEEAPGVFAYLCMENRTAWAHSFEMTPSGTEDLSRRMDALVRLEA